ncbi:MAG: GntR family transcriptional regulator [Firmicutes bacterium HGW-Firmicutes-7]|nr:MAG: GntR family transcriptional regulator [Firmicutes bacterium HGW-Firmicutes-7]
MGAIYIEVKNSILEKINNGFYKAGERIPSERVLSEEYHVSRMTARQAVSSLVIEGAVIREQGKGTFVASKQFSQKNVKSFTQTLKEQGYDPSTIILEFSKVHSLKEISAIMELPYNAQFYKLKRLRLGNGVPIALETVYLPVEKFIGLKQEGIGQSLYDTLESVYGYVVSRVSNDIDACISNRMMMKLFEVQKPVALLKIIGVSYTVDEEMLFYEESYYRSDLYKYQVDIYKRK